MYTLRQNPFFNLKINCSIIIYILARIITLFHNEMLLSKCNTHLGANNDFCLFFSIFIIIIQTVSHSCINPNGMHKIKLKTCSQET